MVHTILTAAKPELTGFCESFDFVAKPASLIDDPSTIGQAQEQELRRRQGLCKNDFMSISGICQTLSQR